MSFVVPNVLPNDPLPRYLYRTTSEKSQGYNCLERFESAAVMRYGSSSFWESDLETRRQVVELHLKWKTKIDRDYFRSDLISWTNSFLFALQHAIRENQEGWRDIKIYILDTWIPSQLDRKEIYPAPLLINALDVPLSHSYSTEFLAIGRVETRDRCHYITLKAIFENYPELIARPSEAKALLARAVESARTMILTSSPEDFTESELSTARSSAEKIHPRFQLPLFLALLSKKNRPANSHLLKDEIEKMITTNDEDTVSGWFLKQDAVLQKCKEAEIVQYSRLFQEAYNIYRPDTIEGLTELTSNLSLTPHYEESFEPYSEEESEDEGYPATVFHYSDDEDSTERNNLNDNIIRMIEGDWGF